MFVGGPKIIVTPLSGSQTRGAGSEIQWDPLNLTPEQNRTDQRAKDASDHGVLSRLVLVSGTKSTRRRQRRRVTRPVAVGVHRTHRHATAAPARSHVYQQHNRAVTIRYDTIRDAILTRARKPTRVSLTYRTEPTTKKCKNRKKLKVENRYAQK